MTSDLVKQMHKKLDKSFMLGSADLLANIGYWVPTSCWPLDAIIGKGIPGGRLIEIYGDESTGKSLVGLDIIANVQAMGGIALLIDPEATSASEFIQGMGVDLDKLLVVNPDTIEEVYDAFNEFMIAKQELDAKNGTITPAVAVWDSVAATTSKAEVDKVASDGLGGATMAVHARAMSKMLRILPREFARTGTTGIFINQTRQKIGVLFGEKQDTSGGRALKFYSSVRIELKVRRPYKADDKVSGIEVRATIKKSKVAHPFGKCVFPILFNEGIDNAIACFWYLKDLEIVTSRGGWHYMEVDGEEIKFRKANWRSVFEQHNEYIRRLILEGEVYRVEEDVKEEDNDG